ncbi:HD domain-containing phosphohydrolase [Vibrio olivae]|uniref:HD domain-containing phosphohydrolase n=1 Tax=Vibrio olivae TaxID=1243002 RepID=A0ABV5HRJ0_9VIBR
MTTSAQPDQIKKESPPSDNQNPDNESVLETSEETVTEKEKLRLLLLDDEQDILKSLTRVLRYDYDVVSFDSGSDALAYLQENDAPLIISDMRMPEMDGAEFLSLARQIRPDSLRFLLTGYSDMESTVKAVNEGGIHTYLAKPWDNEAIKQTLAKAAEVFELKREKRRLLGELAAKNQQLEQMNDELEVKVEERTEALVKANRNLQVLLKNRSAIFNDILHTLMAIIEHRTGLKADHAERIAEISREVAKKLQLPDTDVKQVYLAGLMHEIGLIGEVKEQQELVIDDDEAAIPQAPSSNPEVGAEIIGGIKRFEPLVDIIRHQDENFDGTGKPDHLHGEAIPIGARILRIVKNYDFFVTSTNNPTRMKPASALLYIRQQGGEQYDPDVVKVFIKVVESGLENLDIDACVSLEDVKAGTVLKQDLYLPNGKLMLTAGQALSSHAIAKLKEIEKQTPLPIAIFI